MIKFIHRRKKIRHDLSFNLISIFLWVWALSLVAMFCWGILVSLSDGIYYSSDMSRILPRKWRLMNYIDAINSLKIGDTYFIGMTFNSIWFTVAFTTMRVGSTVMASYVVARYSFKFRKVIYTFIIVQMLLPSYGQEVANYQFLADLHLVDTPFMMISWAAGHGMYFLILYSFFVNLHRDFEDAGRIDGASELTIIFKLMMPMAKPMLIAICIAFGTGVWNDYSTILLYLPSYPTIAAGLFRYKEVAAYTLDIPTYFAGIIIGAIPTTIIFIIFSDTIMKNLTIGGLKG